MMDIFYNKADSELINIIFHLINKYVRLKTSGIYEVKFIEDAY